MEKFDFLTATDEEIESYVREGLKDLPEGGYEISDGDKWLIFTGREGKINSEIAFLKVARDRINDKLC